MNVGRLRYIPALDGFRGVAVLAVCLYHGGVGWVGGGYLGVDAFFVLSGFLITALLVTEERATGVIDRRAFWTRRARRLLPALALVLLAVAAYAAFAADAVELARLRRDALATVAYVANWGQIVTHTSYFEQFAAPSMLRHTWSLAIEEQFYLLWPVVVLLALRRPRGRRFLVPGCLIGAVASAMWMAILFDPDRDPSRVYFGTDTRAQSLLVGAALGAMLARRRPSAPGLRTLHRLAPVAALGLAVMWATTADTATWLYRGGFLLAAGLVAVVLASVVDPRHPGPVGRALAWAPLRGLGIISYGVYLWHWPVYVFVNPDRTGIDGTALLVVRLAVTLAIATASYAFVEQPIRAGTFRIRRPRVALPAGAVVLVGALVLATAGSVPTEFRPASAGAIEAAPTTVPAAPRVMIVGDSVAYSLAPGLRAEADRRGWRLWNVAVPGCGLSSDVGDHWDGVGWRLHEDRCDPPWRARWPLQVAAFRPDVVVMLVGTQDIFDRRINGQVVEFDTLAGTLLARADLDEAISVLSAGGARVVVLTTPYHVLGWPMRIDESRSSMYAPWTDRYNSIQRSAVDASGGRAEIRDLNRLIGPDGVWTDTVAGIRVRNRDRMHLSPEGAAFVADWLAPTLIPGRAGATTSATPPSTPPG